MPFDLPEPAQAALWACVQGILLCVAAFIKHRLKRAIAVSTDSAPPHTAFRLHTDLEVDLTTRSTTADAAITRGS